MAEFLEHYRYLDSVIPQPNQGFSTSPGNPDPVMSKMYLHMVIS